VVFAGEPVTLTATPTGLNPKKTITYTWFGAGASATGNVATIDATTLAAGSYTVQSRILESAKNGASADCGATFTVQAWEPPTLSCDAGGPMTIHPDETSTLRLNGRSPQNLPLTYKCTSSAGKIDVVGNSATSNPEGSAEGPVIINCTVNDDKGKTADCTPRLTIVPRPPPGPGLEPLCSIDFSKDEKHPTRVDNEAKARFDQVALALQQHPDDTLLVVGEAANTELGAQRAVNTKNYLTTEKGIDASRITVVTGDEGTQGVEEYLVPSGASTVQGTHPVDENAVKAQERKPLAMRSPTPIPGAVPTANTPVAKPSSTQGSTGP
jgi:hypothetical protein